MVDLDLFIDRFGSNLKQRKQIVGHLTYISGFTVKFFVGLIFTEYANQAYFQPDSLKIVSDENMN